MTGTLCSAASCSATGSIERCLGMWTVSTCRHASGLSRCSFTRVSALPTPPGPATIHAGALCTGSFVDSVHTRSGFGELHLHASSKASDTDQMFAMGYLEGWLAAERVYDHFHNMRAFFNMTTPKPMQWCASTCAFMFPRCSGSGCVLRE